MVYALGQYANNTFSSLRIRNYRLYYIGQIVSTSGTFMQSVAQAWLVLQLSNSGTALGLVMALQYLPVLFLGPYGGVIADRFSKRKLLFFTVHFRHSGARTGHPGTHRGGPPLDGRCFCALLWTDQYD